MSRRLSILLLAALYGLAACGGDDCPVTIFYIIDGAPTYLAYRNGSDAWQVPAIDSDGTYHMCVDTSIEVVSVCQGSDTFLADEFLALSSEQTEIDGPPCNVTGSGSNVTATGSVTVPGSVGIADSLSSGSSTPWTYAVSIPVGTYDIIASSSVAGGSGNVEIVRAQTFAADKSVNVDPTIGTPLVSEAIDIDGLGSNVSVSVLTTYVTSTSESPISIETTPTVLAVPASAIPAGDDQEIDVAAIGSNGNIGTDQTIEAEFATGSATPSFAVLGILDGASFDTSPVGVSWNELPAFTDLEYELVAPPGGGLGSVPQSSERVTMSSNYQLTLKPSGVAFDTSAPNYPSKWIISPTDPYDIAIIVFLESITQTVSTSIDETVTPTADDEAPRIAPARRPVLPRRPRGRL